MQHELILSLRSREFLTLSILLVCIILLSSCQKQTATSFNTNSYLKEVGNISKDWKKIETEDFSFSIPPTMKNKNVRGIDTEVWQYEDGKITLTIEQGDMLGDLSKSTDFVAQRYESKTNKTIVNDDEVIILSLDLNKPKLENWATNVDGSTSFKIVEKNILLSFSFPNQQTVFSTESSTPEAQEISQTILYSIKFKQK